MSTARRPGRLLASGREADVFEYGDGMVLRRYRQGQPAERDARVMEHARANGFPAPEVHDASGPDLVMDRVDGPLLLEDLARRPWRLRGGARLLAQLHRRLHAIAAPGWMPEEIGPGDRLIHFDLHPGNVILSEHGPVVIDWTNATRGDPVADVAMTWIIARTSALPPLALPRPVMHPLRLLYLRSFLRHFDADAVARVLPAVAAARMKDRNVLDEERERIRAMVHRVPRRG